jgi:hypothetical protein
MTRVHASEILEARRAVFAAGVQTYESNMAREIDV